MKQGEQLFLFDPSSDEDYVNRDTQGRSMDFNEERNCFNHLKSSLDNKTKTEYELGVNNLINRYNTAIYENRFTVGGVVEVFTLALLRSTGIKIDDCGSEAHGGDLILPTGKMFSVKSSFTTSGGVILINTRGDSGTKWSTATLFILSNVGIVYGDPSMVSDDDLKRNRDNLEIRRATLKRFAQDMPNVVPMNIDLKPSTDMVALSSKASHLIARELMKELKLDSLRNRVSELEQDN